MAIKGTDINAESWLGTIGVTSFLDTDGPAPASSAANVTDKIRERANKFASARPADQRPEQPFSIMRLSEALHRDPGIPEKMASFADLPEELSFALAERATAAISFLRRSIPATTRPGILGPEERKPSSREINRFRRVFEVVNDPISAMDDLVSGSLRREQVDALKEVYPLLYKDAVGAVLTSLGDAKARRQSTVLSPARGKQLRVILGQESAQAAQTTAIIQQALDESEKAKGTPAGPAARLKSTEGTETLGQSTGTPV